MPPVNIDRALSGGPYLSIKVGHTGLTNSDIGVDAGEEIGVERGSDFGTTAGRQASRHADSMPGTFARQMMPALRVYPE
jgi:hypothetical protein